MPCFIERLRKIITESAAVKHSAHTNDAIAGKSSRFQCQIGHRIHRIGDNNENCVWRILKCLLYNTLYNLCVNSDKLFTGHSGFTRQTGGNNDDIRVCRSCIVVRNANHGRIITKGMCRLHHVHCFSFGNTFFNVNENNFARKFLEGDDICHRSTYIACANNSYLHPYFLLKERLATHF